MSTSLTVITIVSTLRMIKKQVSEMWTHIVNRALQASWRYQFCLLVLIIFRTKTQKAFVVLASKRPLISTRPCLSPRGQQFGEKMMLCHCSEAVTLETIFINLVLCQMVRQGSNILCHNKFKIQQYNLSDTALFLLFFAESTFRKLQHYVRYNIQGIAKATTHYPY